MRALLKNEWTIFVIALVASLLTAILTFTAANVVLVFLVSAVALATLASVVGQATEQLGNYMGIAIRDWQPARIICQFLRFASRVGDRCPVCPGWFYSGKQPACVGPGLRGRWDQKWHPEIHV